MRITFVIPPADLSGGIRVLALYAEGLRRKGHQVRVISVSQPRPTLREIARSLWKGQGWPPQPVNGPSHFDGLAVEHRRVSHSGPVTDADVPEADVVIASWWETVEWVAALSDSRGVKVHFMQDYEIWGGFVDRVDATCRLPIPKIVIAAWVRDLLETRFHQSPVALIPNSVDTERFHAPPRGKQAAPTVGTVYTTMHSKGCSTCLKAFDLAIREIPNLRLVSFGSNPVAPEMPLPANAEFACRLQDQQLKEVYARCDAWLFGSRQEGFGLPILEAMACRTPVIATPGGAAPELVSKGGGILVPPDDAAAMAQAIVKVCSMPDADWRALSDTALKTATSYTWADAIDLMEQTLTKIGQRRV
jgi:glycosyltransferase involved in cell wall biosynthesis